MNEAVQEVIETGRGSIAVAGEPTALRSILFSVHDDDGLDARLQCALSLARACSAHLTLLQVLPVAAYSVSDPYGGAFISGDIVEALQEQADKVRLHIEGQLRKEDVSWTFEQITSAIIPELLRNAALADLVIAGRQPSFREFSRSGPSVLGELVCSARTPICIFGDGRTTFDPFAKAVIAWNGSIEAANAVRESIGLLKMASEVDVVRFTEDKELLLSDTELLEYLSRHDVHASFKTDRPGADPGSQLVDYADRSGAEYIIMGGYSHSRAGEFLFGGVTRELLQHCEICLVVAH